MPSRKKQTNSAPAPISSVHHSDKRINNPTEELRDFMPDDEKSAYEIPYPRHNNHELDSQPRDPDFDPQLMWHNKEVQNREPLRVLTPPIYTQEKINAQAIIEEFRRQVRFDANLPAPLFEPDFNGITFEELLDFYHHPQSWANRMILGDSLMVMSSLAEKEGMKGKVQMIYIDPPYGIKFGSNWQVSTRKRDVKDGNAAEVTPQPEQIRAFRDTWHDGIHSYLTYLRDRLTIAHELLTDSGSIFVQINSENAHLIRNLLDEVFGSENFVTDIIFRKKSIPLGATYLETMHDHIVLYARNVTQLKFRHLYEETDISQISSHGPYAMFPNGTWEKIDTNEFRNTNHPNGTKYYRLFSLLAPSYSANTDFNYTFEGITYPPPNKGSWVVSAEKLNTLGAIGRLQPEGKSLSYRLFLEDFPYKKRTNLWNDAQVSYEKSYVVQTAPSIIARCILMTTDPGDLVLDPTCGSGTTAYVAEQWGRRWITIDTSRVALALARTRLMTARFPYYLLADSYEGRRKEQEITNAAIELKVTEKPDIRQGFIYKRVPHITLKSIANNEEIDAIYVKWTAEMEPRRAWINEVTGNSWEEWDIPHEAGASWSDDLKEVHAEWLRLRYERQQEIDASIARHADTEFLYDQPYEDPKRFRVAGPFTVESLSPHRVLVPEEDRPAGEVIAQQDNRSESFEERIISNLRVAGIQNTRKEQRLTLDHLETYSGEWIQAAGEYTENDQTKRIAIAIGPETNTIGRDFIKEAAKEAVRGIGFDLLVVCGFAFDPMVSEETKRYGNLTVLIVHMNPDLAMGDDLLKKTGAGNLFMVFGEPDIDIQDVGNGQLCIEIKGVDIYDPTTGEVRSSSTDDIACWFIDTRYKGEAFFVRHAYFTGAGDPYEKLKRSLRAEVNEEAWAALNATVSRPFDRPETGQMIDQKQVKSQ